MPDARKQPPIVMRDVTRRFDDFTAVDDLSLEVLEGIILGLIGPSGSGKTTAIRMLTGILEPSSGDVRVLGEDPRRFRRGTRERLGYMPQLFVLWQELTASENVSFVASLFGLLWLRRRRRVREVLQTVDLWEARHRRAKQLSGGMQRRLALATALVHEPDLLFIDEPTAGLDPALRQRIWKEFRQLRDRGKTLLVTTQHIEEAEHCDRVALLAEGQLVALDTPERLRQGAMGGEMIEVTTKGPVDADLLRGLPGVRAVQLSMLVLLASVFLSGFVLPLEEFTPLVRDVAYALPVTHGIRLIQDTMLRGYSYAPWQIWALGALGVALFLLNNVTLRRGMKGI